MAAFGGPLLPMVKPPNRFFDLITTYQEGRDLFIVSSSQAGARKRELLGEREFCSVVQRAQETVRRKLSDLKGQSSPRRVGGVHGPYRLVFTGKNSHTVKNGFIRPEAKSTVGERVAASDVISELKKRKVRLLAELKQRQEACRQKVGEAIEGLSQVLLITPMKR
uniref:Uncharacterized protein n=1 Tax=Sphaerodactylus townsendi TaxID=933632 RepID=A0ACB8F2J7_9SAUR